MTVIGAEYQLSDPVQRQRGLAAASAALHAGGLVRLPLESADAWVADAFSAAGVQALRGARGRPALVPQVLVASREMVAGVALVSALAQQLMTAFWPGGLTLLLTAQPSLAWNVAAATQPLPVRMPLSAAGLELIERTGPLAVAPAGADSLARVILVGERSAEPGEPPSVVDARTTPPVLLRSGQFTAEQLRAVCPSLRE
ncbi:MAG: L-threonylcarbamoyladenylate synthase [Candidatus Nanopelagicales bacterium]